jgi:hypothetical protein
LKLCIRADIVFAVGSPGIVMSKATVHLDALNRYSGTMAYFVGCVIAAHGGG